MFNSWNKTGSTIQIQCERAMINNNYFIDNIGNAIIISNNADKVTITNNHFNNNTVDYIAKPTVLVANNLLWKQLAFFLLCLIFNKLFPYIEPMWKQNDQVIFNWQWYRTNR